MLILLWGVVCVGAIYPAKTYADTSASTSYTVTAIVEPQTLIAVNSNNQIVSVTSNTTDTITPIVTSSTALSKRLPLTGYILAEYRQVSNLCRLPRIGVIYSSKCIPKPSSAHTSVFSSFISRLSVIERLFS